MFRFIDEDEVRTLRAWGLAEQLRRDEFLRHPDCRDPDHPGCSRCMEEEELQGEEVSHV